MLSAITIVHPQRNVTNTKEKVFLMKRLFAFVNEKYF